MHKRTMRLVIPQYVTTASLPYCLMPSQWFIICCCVAERSLTSVRIPSTRMTRRRKRSAGHTLVPAASMTRGAVRARSSRSTERALAAATGRWVLSEGRRAGSEIAPSLTRQGTWDPQQLVDESRDSTHRITPVKRTPRGVCPPGATFPVHLGLLPEKPYGREARASDEGRVGARFPVDLWSFSDLLRHVRGIGMPSRHYPPPARANNPGE